MIALSRWISRRQNTALLAAAVTVLGVGSLRAADPEADKFFAEARVKEEQAQKLRTAAAAKLQEAGNDEAKASEAEHEAKVFTARALHILKADGNRMRAYQLRGEGRQFWNQGHRLLIESRNAELQAEHDKHNEAELAKAIQAVHDQPTVAAALENDSRTLAADAQRHEQESATKKAQAQTFIKRAAAVWAEAEKLDPEAHGKVAAQPVAPTIQQVLRRDK